MSTAYVDETPAGGWPWEGVAPGPGLAAVLAGVDVAGLPGEGRVSFLVAADRLTGWSQVQTARAVASVAAAYEDLPPVAGEWVTPDRDRVAQDEVAAALRVARRTAAARISTAVWLTERWPRLGEAIASGALTWAQGLAIADQVALVDGVPDPDAPTTDTDDTDPDAADALEPDADGESWVEPGVRDLSDVVVDRVLDRGPGRFAPARLREFTAAAVLAADPAAASRRRRRAVRDGTDVSVWPEADGMACLAARGPAPAAVAAGEVIRDAGATLRAAAAAAGIDPASRTAGQWRLTALLQALGLTQAPTAADDQAADSQAATGLGLPPLRPTAHADADPAAGANADATSSSDAGSRAEADANSGADADSDADADADTETGSAADAGTGPALPDADVAGAAVTGPGPGDGPDVGPSGAATGGVVGCPAPASAPGTGAVRPVIKVTVDLLTLLGLAATPGHLDGYGPIDPDLARALAADGDWQRWVTDPVTGYLLDEGDRRYPGARLSRYIHARDHRCTHPACATRRRTDNDHIPEYRLTRHTHAAGLGRVCPWHNRSRDASGWTVAPSEFRHPDAGPEPVWTSPLGRRYRTLPDVPSPWTPAPDPRPPGYDDTGDPYYWPGNSADNSAGDGAADGAGAAVTPPPADLDAPPPWRDDPAPAWLTPH